jgi:photosystem II stability/assembly factor-like uncharacterized protein
MLYARAWGDGTLLIRSRDGGLTWDTIAPDWGPGILATQFVQPHPVDPARVLRLAGLYPFGHFVGGVEVSDDRGTTWEHHGQPDLSDVEGLSTGIIELVGFGGIMPERLYVTTRSWEPVPGHAPRPVGGSVFRSDDEGRTWTQILSIVHPGQEEIPPEVTGLAYDPGDPDVVYVATRTGVQASRDGGQTWSGLGQERLPEILALALGIDGRYLYAATDTGVFRLRLID